VLGSYGVLAPNLKVATNERNRAGRGRRLYCRDVGPSRCGDVLGLVTRRLPDGYSSISSAGWPFGNVGSRTAILSNSAIAAR